MFGKIPKSVGAYDLVGRLGIGGTSTVYLGRKIDARGGLVHAAVKCLHPHLQELDDIVRMFLDEARLLARLSHPNIVEVYDWGVEDGVPYIAMPNLNGTPLNKLLERSSGHPLPPNMIAWITSEVCAGLHHAHEAKTEDGKPFELVHRDVSPQNIFVTFSGQVKLIDFGIAKLQTQDRYTEAGQLKGKDGYMSPEQVECQTLDRRSDVFTLGIVLWESLAKERLFERRTQLATALAITEDDAPDIRSKNPLASAALARVLAKSLQRDRAGRFQTADQMGAALSSTLPSGFNPQLGLRQQLISLFEDDHNDTQLDMSQSEVNAVRREDPLDDDPLDDDPLDDDLLDGDLLDDDPDLISVPEVPTFDPEPEGTNDTQILPSLSIAKNTLPAGADLNPTPPGARPRPRTSQAGASARGPTPLSTRPQVDSEASPGVVSDDTAELPAQKADPTRKNIRWGRWVFAIIFLGTLIVAAVVAGSNLQ